MREVWRFLGPVGTEWEGTAVGRDGGRDDAMARVGDVME